MFAASLPDLDSLDLEAAKVLLIAQHQSYTATLSSRSTEIERLVLLVEKLQRMLRHQEREGPPSDRATGTATGRVTSGQRHRGTRSRRVGRSARRDQALPQTAAGTSST